jgi:hypothetical protein
VRQRDEPHGEHAGIQAAGLHQPDGLLAFCHSPDLEKRRRGREFLGRHTKIEISKEPTVAKATVGFLLMPKEEHQSKQT